MNYELIIPHSRWLDEDLRTAIRSDLALPALTTLYGKGTKSVGVTRFESHDTLLDEWSRRCGRTIAAAPTSLLLDDPDAPPGYWLRADPVHLRIDRDRLTVLGSTLFALSQAEANELVAALNALFGGDGYLFIAPTPTRWYLRLPQNPQLQFTPLSQALGRNMNDCLPQGADALAFHAVINEIQMVLFGNAVNDARDAAGLAMVNSVWLWGGGDYPAQPAMPSAPAMQPLVYGGGELVQALQGDAWQAAPQTAAQLPQADVCVVLDDLSLDAIYGNAYEWRLAWQSLERDWFAPLLAQLRAGALQQLTLTFPDGEGAQQVRIRKSDLLRFWRKRALPF